MVNILREGRKYEIVHKIKHNVIKCPGKKTIEHVQFRLFFNEINFPCKAFQTFIL